MSDVTGVSRALPDVTIGASYGDALLAAQGAGLVAAEATWARIGRIVEPDLAVAPVYDELDEIFEDLRVATMAIHHRLARLEHDVADRAAREPAAARAGGG